MIKFPKHNCGLYLSHNPHKDNYETVTEWADINGRTLFNSESDFERAVDSDDFWELHWYPDTPIGFYRVCAPTLQELLDYVNQEFPE